MEIIFWEHLLSASAGNCSRRPNNNFINNVTVINLQYNKYFPFKLFISEIDK